MGGFSLGLLSLDLALSPLLYVGFHFLLWLVRAFLATPYLAGATTLSCRGGLERTTSCSWHLFLFVGAPVNKGGREASNNLSMGEKVVPFQGERG